MRSPQSVESSPKPMLRSLETFQHLRQTVLRSADQQEEFARLRRSRTVLLDAIGTLTEDSQPSQPDRAEAISLLQEALADSANPEAAFVAEQVERILFADDLGADKPESVRRELAANKGELMLSYLGAYPSNLGRVLQETKGTTNETLTENVIAIGERRKQQSLAIVNELNAAEDK